MLTMCWRWRKKLNAQLNAQFNPKLNHTADIFKRLKPLNTLHNYVPKAVFGAGLEPPKAAFFTVGVLNAGPTLDQRWISSCGLNITYF